MAQGDRLGNLKCPCCGGVWNATEQKGGGVTLKCARGFMGWAKNPASNTGIRAALATTQPPGPPTAPGKSKGLGAIFDD